MPTGSSSRRDPVPHSRPLLGAGEARAAARVIASRQVSQGPEVAAFEEEFAAFAGVPHATAVSSGTAALALVLSALGAGGGEVLVPAYACRALENAVHLSGARPVPVDVDPATGRISAVDAQRRAGPGTRAAVAVHIFGLPMDLSPLFALGVPVVEDCAQAAGATYQGRPVGGEGAASIFSFYATKMLCAGEGGMVLSHDPGIVDDVRRLRENLGGPPGGNFKMTDLAAAVGRVQLRRLPAFVEKRRQIAARYRESFSGLPVDLPSDDPGHAWCRFVLSVPRAREAAERINREGVCAELPVGPPGRAPRDFPGAAQCRERFLSVPLYPALTRDELPRVIRAVRQGVRSP